MNEQGNFGMSFVEKKENETSHLIFPQADAAENAYVTYSQDPESGKLLRDILDKMLRVELDNTRIYTRKDGEAGFPYTTINITDFAKKIYKDMGGTLPQITTNPEEQPKKKAVLVFPSTTIGRNGYPFSYVEIAMQQTMRGIYRVVNDLKNGKQPDEVTVTTLGATTNDRWGHISKAYAQRIHKNAFQTNGETYAEMLENSGLMKGFTGKDTVELWGTSMGVSNAVTTAEHLLSHKIVSQTALDRQEKDIPLLQIRGDAPAGMLDPKADKPWSHAKKIGWGFLKEAGRLKKTDPDFAKFMEQEPEFIDMIEKKVKTHGVLRADKNENLRKWKAIFSTIYQLLRGTPMPEDLKVYLVKGYHDLTTINVETDTEIKNKMDAMLSGNIASLPIELKQKVRTFGAAMTHVVPFFQKNEMKRWKRSIDLLEEIQKAKSNQQEKVI